MARNKMRKRLYKRSIIGTQRFKTLEFELTWDLFIKCLNEVYEFYFYYQDLTFDIAFHFEDNKKVYELNINYGDYCKCLCFDTVDELVSSKQFDGKCIRDIWEDLEN